MGDLGDQPPRGIGNTLFRDVRCKDCLREQFFADRSGEAIEDSETHFEYSEVWASRVLDRGGSRTDRCARHRREHRQTIQGIAVAYIDLVTIGSVANPKNPTGPLGGLGELPPIHKPKPVAVDLANRQFGMTDDDIRKALRKLGNNKTRVLILKAGTGTGKSTFAPYRLMNPPTGQPGDEDLLRLVDLGPIIVTEPRVQATTGVARFVGEKLVAGCKWKNCSVHGRFVPAREADPAKPEGPDHLAEVTDDCVITDCSDHIGPGYPVGYQVKDDKKHDDSCQLVYVTDGTMVNWLREGRLSKIGTVIVDEAHERSVNIDFILGELKRQLPRYPHLRVIVASATFDVDFYVDFFGGPDVVEHMDVPAVKSFGYGAPFFPHAGQVAAAIPACHCPPLTSKTLADHPHRDGDPTSYDTWLKMHWPQQIGPAVGERSPEDLHATTRQLEKLRFPGPTIEDKSMWKGAMPGLLVEQVARMIKGLDEMDIHGDILAFLPTANMIRDAVADIQKAIQPTDADAPDLADVFGLVGSMPKDEQAEALAARPPDARRKVVIATNLAETSLTVEGVRFVVDSGIITQSVWDPRTATGDVPTVSHSQAGIRQRWGRVGRDAPGWVFPLYTVNQFDTLPPDTPPQSTRANLEKLIMTAKAGGVDNLEDFPWPADWHFGELDQTAKDARATFRDELVRAEGALVANGVLDTRYGYLTTFGKEIQRFQVTGASAATAVATMLADHLACVPETIAALALLAPEDSNRGLSGLFLSRMDWPILSQTAATLRSSALRLACRDDLDLVLRISAGWDRADFDAPPWELTEERRAWCARWWLNEKVLVAAAEMRHDTLSALSPAMKEEVKRYVDPRLGPRVRAILARALKSCLFERLTPSDNYVSAIEPNGTPLSLNKGLVRDMPQQLLAFANYRKDKSPDGAVALKHLVRVLPWALDDSSGVFDFMERASIEVAPRRLREPDHDQLLPYINSWPTGMVFRAKFKTDGTGQSRIDHIVELLPTSLPKAQERSGGGDSNWLLGPPLEDEDLLAGQPIDTADDPEDPEKGLENNEAPAGEAAGAAADVLAAWIESAAARQVENPVVLLDSRADALNEQLVWGCVAYRELPGGEIGLVLATQICVVDADIPRERRSGPNRIDLGRLAALPDLVSCEYLPSGGPLRMVATSPEALRAVATEFGSTPATFRGTLTMPSPDGARHIVGASGARIRLLRQTSGVTRADCPQGSNVWSLAGPTVESIEVFIREATRVVPGCVGDIQPIPGVTLQDRVARQPISDPGIDQIASIPVAAWILPGTTDGATSPQQRLGHQGEIEGDIFERISRAALSSLQLTYSAKVDTHGLGTAGQEAIAAFCFGLAHAVIGATCDVQPGGEINISWPHAPLMPPINSAGRYSAFDVMAWDDSLEPIGRALRLGTNIELHFLAEDFENTLRCYFYGMAAALRLKVVPVQDTISAVRISRP